MWNKIDLENFEIKPFNLIANDWYLIGVKSRGRSNMMTASWGQIGHLWKKHVFTLYVRPQRFTRPLLDESDYFTVSVLPKQKEALNFLGRESGRDYSDKIKSSGLSETTIDGHVTVEEAELVLICKKLYRQQLEEDLFEDSELAEERYPNKDYSIQYIGEVVAAYHK